jgi:hypothetical protein
LLSQLIVPLDVTLLSISTSVPRVLSVVAVICFISLHLRKRVYK